MSNGKSQRSRRNGTASVVKSTALTLPQITRTQANQILKARAVELYGAIASPAARIVVAVGKARGHIRQRYKIAESDMLATIEIAGKSRLIAFLPHPSSYEPGPRTFTGLYSPKDLQRLRETVAG